MISFPSTFELIFFPAVSLRRRRSQAVATAELALGPCTEFPEKPLNL